MRQRFFAPLDSMDDTVLPLSIGLINQLIHLQLSPLDIEKNNIFLTYLSLEEFAYFNLIRDLEALIVCSFDEHHLVNHERSHGPKWYCV